MLKTERYAFYLFLVIFLSAIILQVWRLDYVTLWSDEFRGTLTLIQLPWKDLLAGNYSWEFNPPLYYLILKAWISILNSDTESTMRMLSVFMSIGSFLAIYLLGKNLGSWHVGIALMSVVAFHPIYLAYSTQLRMYPLLIFLSITALLFYSRYTFSEHSKKQWLLALGIVLVFATYTHYFGVFLTLAILILSAFFLIGKKDQKQWAVLWTILLSILFTVPLTGIFMQQYSHYVEKALSLSENYPPLNIKIIIPLLSGNVLFDFKVSEPAHVLSFLAVVSGIIVLIRNGKKIIAFALLTAIFLSSLIVIAISTRNINIVPRYLIHISLLGWVIASLSLIETRDNTSKLLRIFVILAIGFNSSFGIIVSINREYFAPNWKTIARILIQEAHKDEPIVIMGWDASPTGYYLGEGWLTSYALEDQLISGNAANNYLILDSEHSRKLNFIDYSHPIYEDPDWEVKIVRYIPVNSKTILDGK